MRRELCPRNGTQGAALVVALLAAPVAFAQTERTELKPVWDRTFDRGIEWCAPVGAEPASGLLLCTKDARVDLINLGTGHSRLAETILVQPGTQFAGTVGDLAYGYGVSQICAFQFERCEGANAGKPGLLWRVVAALPERTEGDPEFMTRIVAARATPSGVLIVRSDGRIAELVRADGSVRWRYNLPTIDNCTLHVRGSSATLHWKQGDAFNVAFLDLTADTQDPTVRVVKEPLPIWTKLTDDGLVVVWRKRFGVVSASGRLRFHEMHSRVGASAEAWATNVDVCSPRRYSSEERNGDGERSEALLIVSDTLGGLAAYDPATGELRWPDNDALPVLPCGEGCRWLRVSGNHILQVGLSWFAVRRIDGNEGFSSREHPYMCVAAGIWERFAYGLFVHMSPRSGRSARAHLRLVRGVIGPLDARQQHKARTLDAREFALGEVGTIRDTFWLGGTFVVVEDRRVRAYTLP